MNQRQFFLFFLFFLFFVLFCFDFCFVFWKITLNGLQMESNVIFKTVTKFEIPLSVALPVVRSEAIDMLRCILPGGGMGVESASGEGGTAFVGAMYSTSATTKCEQWYQL
jgi:hypothetical protein